MIDILTAAWANQFMLWSWQALILLGLTWVIVRSDRSNLPAVRYQIWLVAMIIVAILPVCAAFVALLPVHQPTIESLAYMANLPSAIRIESDPATDTPSNLDAQIAGIATVASVARVLFGVWLAGFLWKLAFLSRSYWKMRTLLKEAQEVQSPDLSGVVVRSSSGIRSPIVAGIIRPMILLPGRIEEWTNEEERRAIVLHERAHLARRDHYLVVVQRLLEAVFFFHPMFRYASRQLSLERELACDEYVLSAGADASAYADAILKVAEHDIRGLHHLQPAFNSSRKVLERRMDMILNRQHQGSPSGARRLTILAKAFALVALMGWLLIPQGEVIATVASSTELQIIKDAFAKYQPVVPPTPVVVAQAQIRPSPQAAPPARVLLSSVATQAVGQSEFARLSGKVYDGTGAVIPGVMVKVSSGQAESTAITNVSGAYAFSQLAAGDYRLEASLPGFRTQVLTFKLAAGATDQRNLTLQLAGVVTQVEVSMQRLPAVAVAPAAGQVPGPPPLVRVGGVVAQAQLIFAPKPIYPANARAAGIQGAVTVEAIITKEGTVTSLALIGGPRELADAALEAVKQWRYKPQFLNGQPVDVITTITVNFSLTD